MSNSRFRPALVLACLLAASILACNSTQYLLDELDTGSLPGGPTDYALAVSVNETDIYRFQCLRSPWEIETEPPYLIFECPPTELALREADIVDMVMLHPHSGQSNGWSDITSRRFLRMTTVAWTSSPAGETFGGWDGETVIVAGFDINASQVPGDAYFDP